MIVLGIIMAMLGLGGILAVRVWRKNLQARRAQKVLQASAKGRQEGWYSTAPAAPLRARHPGINPISYVEKPRSNSDDDSGSMLNTIVTAEILSSIESSHDSSSSSSSDSSWGDSSSSDSSSSDSSPSSDFTAGGDSGGGGASGDW